MAPRLLVSRCGFVTSSSDKIAEIPTAGGLTDGGLICVWEITDAVIWPSTATGTSCRVAVRIMDRLWHMRRWWCKNTICTLDLKRDVLDSCSYEAIIVIDRKSRQPNLHTRVIDVVDSVTVMGIAKFIWPACINILIRFAIVATNSEPPIYIITPPTVSNCRKFLSFCLQVFPWFAIHRLAGKKSTLFRHTKPAQLTEKSENFQILPYLVIAVSWGDGGALKIIPE